MRIPHNPATQYSIKMESDFFRKRIFFQKIGEFSLAIFPAPGDHSRRFFPEP